MPIGNHRSSILKIFKPSKITQAPRYPISSPTKRLQVIKLSASSTAPNKREKKKQPSTGDHGQKKKRNHSEKLPLHSFTSAAADPTTHKPTTTLALLPQKMIKPPIPTPPFWKNAAIVASIPTHIIHFIMYTRGEKEREREIREKGAASPAQYVRGYSLSRSS